MLYGAQVHGTIGLDLAGSGARIHPFFELSPDTPFGTVKLLNVEGFTGAWGAPPVDLCCHRGALLWRSRQNSGILTFSPTGAGSRLQVAGNKSVVALFPDIQGTFWVIQEAGFILYPGDSLLGMHAGNACLTSGGMGFGKGWEKPVAMAAGAAGLCHFWYESWSLTCQVPQGAGEPKPGSPLPNQCPCLPGARVTARATARPAPGRRRRTRPCAWPTWASLSDHAWNGTDCDYDVVTAYPVPDAWN